ncbi:SigE family RNA polymerase sigma factor [Kitasatospora sp. NPDC052896]|uniref:SigE family RNA polymerase sigma factor n=1 Tax=Kitasatospora sp. NPDC052896 TaxID=3364061 RepID=UPI0037C870FE
MIARRGDGDGGDRVDFGEFVRQRSAALFRTAYLLTGSRERAEDLVQEGLEKAYRHWRRICATDSPEAYVRRIVVNLANDSWRSRRRAGECTELVDRPVGEDPYLLVDLRDELVHALHALPMGMRTAVVLYYLHDMDDQQIAEVQGVSPSTVRSQLARALAKLRAAHEFSTPPPDSRGERRHDPLPLQRRVTT